MVKVVNFTLYVFYHNNVSKVTQLVSGNIDSKVPALHLYAVF